MIVVDFINFLAAQQPVVEQTKTFGQMIKDWLPFYGALATSVIVGVFSLIQNKPKSKKDRFEVFMDESESYREELRKDRDRLQKEVAELHTERLILKKQIETLEEKLEKIGKKL